MKPYAVEVTLHMVVMADDEKHARTVGRRFVRDAVYDNDPDDVYTMREVTCDDDMPEGWDGLCIPYNGDGNTRLKDLLPANGQGNGPRE